MSFAFHPPATECSTKDRNHPVQSTKGRNLQKAMRRIFMMSINKNVYWNKQCSHGDKHFVGFMQVFIDKAETVPERSALVACAKYAVLLSCFCSTDAA